VWPQHSSSGDQAWRLLWLLSPLAKLLLQQQQLVVVAVLQEAVSRCYQLQLPHLVWCMT
jgi:hypothetical protein